MRYYLFFLLSFIVLAGNAQYTRENKVFIDTFENGKIYLYKTVRTKQSKQFNLHEFYQLTDSKSKFYFPNGTKSMEVQRIIKKGNFGKYCFELKFEQKEYYPNGQLKSKEVNSCDCYKEKKFQFDVKGKLISVERTKNRSVKRKMD